MHTKTSFAPYRLWLLVLLLFFLASCGTETVSWPDNVMAVDVNGGAAEDMLTITCFTPDSQAPFSVKLSLNQLKTLKSVFAQPQLARITVNGAALSEDAQTELLKTFSAVTNPDLSLAMDSVTVSLESLEKCPASELHLVSCDLTQLPGKTVERLVLTDCTGMDWNRLNEFEKLEYLSLTGLSMMPETLDPIIAHGNITGLCMCVPFQDTGYDGEMPLVLHRGDSCPEELLPLIPYSTEELDTFLHKDNAVLDIRFDYDS